MTITFETTEFPLYTRNPHYDLDDLGLSVQFYGYTQLDGAHGESNVILSGNPANFMGSTYMVFSEAVRYVSFTVGYIDAEGTVTVRATSPFGQTYTLTSTEIDVRETFEFDFRDFTNIKRSIKEIEIIVSGDEPAGAGVNDVNISDPVDTGKPPKLTVDLDDVEPGIFRNWGRIDDAAPGTVLASRKMYTNVTNDTEAYAFQFSNGLEVSRRFTFEVYNPNDPGEIRTFKKIFAPGTHRIAVSEDRISGDFDGEYVIRLKAVGKAASQTDDPFYVLAEIFDGVGLSMASLLDNLKAFENLKNPIAAEKFLAKYLGPLGIGLDIGARATQIALADDHGREAFAQIIDALFSYSVTYGLLIGGSATLTPVGGALASLGGSIVYNTFASGEVKQAARETYDIFTEFEEVPGAGATGMLASATGTAGVAVSAALDPDDLVTEMFSRIDFSTGVPEFDEAYYLEQHPNVAAQIARGEIASAYVHYLTRGVFKGLTTYEGQTDVPDPSEVIGAGLTGDPGGRPEVLTPIYIQHLYQPIEEKPFAGDGASDTEWAFMDAVVEAFYPHAADDSYFNGSRLWALANRMAWDLVHNHPDQTVAEAVYGQPFITEWSDGRSADDIFDVAGWNPELMKFFAVKPDDGTPEGAVAELARSFDFVGNFSQVQQDVMGVAEYGGVYVVAVWFSGSSYGPDLVKEDHDIDRIGTLSRDEMSLGTWTGTLRGLAGNDTLTSGTDGGKLFGGAGDDELTGRNSRDVIRGGNGDDLIQAAGGRDRLAGQKGDDLIDGGRGNDVASGGNGADTLAGGAGNDTLTGGRGEDVFVFGAGDARDVVRDFTDGIDLLMIDPALAGSMREIRDAAREKDGDLLLRFGDDVLVIRDMTLDKLGSADILFDAVA